MNSSGDELLAVLGALASPPRLRILALLTTKGRLPVSQLARRVGISRPLANLHLKKLEAAGLVGRIAEISAAGRATNFFEVAPFNLALTPSILVKAAKTLRPTRQNRS